MILLNYLQSLTLLHQNPIFIFRDPNDIIGPSGYGNQNWLTPDQILPYTIRFENQASATAPAVLVTVTQQLDSDLDLSTFKLGDFRFDDIYIGFAEKLHKANLDATQPTKC